MATVQNEYTAVTIIVVKASLRAAAEQAAIAADPEAGAGTFSPGTPLRLAGQPNEAVAYWCRWNMKQAQRSTFASSMGGPNNIISPGGNVPAFTDNRDRWFFDASGSNGWTGEQVLTALGLAPFASTRDAGE